MRTVWVTGAAGFSGIHLVRYLRNLGKGLRIVGLDVAEAEPPDIDAYARVDLLIPEAVTELARREPPAWVIHLAGCMPPASQEAMWNANVGGTIGLLVGLWKADLPGVRVVSVGSAAEYEPPADGFVTEQCPGPGPSAYGRSKWAQSMLALQMSGQAGIELMVTRVFNLIGPRLPTRLVAGALCAQFVDPTSTVVRVGNTSTRRDFVDVRDAVAAYWSVAERGRPGETYNVCSGRPVSVESVLGMLAEAAGRSPRIEMDAARLRANDPAVVFGDNAKIRQATGWTASIPLTESLRDMISAARQAAAR